MRDDDLEEQTHIEMGATNRHFNIEMPYVLIQKRGQIPNIDWIWAPGSSTDTHIQKSANKRKKLKIIPNCRVVMTMMYRTEDGSV